LFRPRQGSRSEQARDLSGFDAEDPGHIGSGHAGQLRGLRVFAGDPVASGRL
jgi:hypothetical protein